MPAKPPPPDDTLYYGDNLTILRNHKYIKDESVDLVYLDPPFNSNQAYNILFDEQDGSRSAAQIKAFTDTWRWDKGSAAQFTELVQVGGDVSRAMQAFRQLLGDSNVLAYLTMMAPRLVEMRRALKLTGSVFLHCDPTSSHYLKALLDAVFGPKNFRNEIIWHYNTGGKGRNTFLRKHDTILWYTRSDEYRFLRDQVALPRTIGTAHLRHGVDNDGREFYEDYSPRKSGKQYRWYLDDGLTPMDVWTDIQALNPAARERQGYPTQKPEALLERIIKATTVEGDIILDPFCGCGTAVVTAESFGRHWIGIDVTSLATALIKRRLFDKFAGKARYNVIGEPVSLSEAMQLAADDRYQFQWWALGLVGARPTDEKKGADHGIDGRLYFQDDPQRKIPKQIVLSVKSGKTGVDHIRELRGVLVREKAEIAVLITLQPPTKPMREEVADGEYYVSPWGVSYPRLQILTIAELLNGIGIAYPPASQVNQTFPKAPRYQPPVDSYQRSLPHTNLLDVSKQEETAGPPLQVVGGKRERGTGD